MFPRYRILSCTACLYTHVPSTGRDLRLKGGGKRREGSCAEFQRGEENDHNFFGQDVAPLKRTMEEELLATRREREREKESKGNGGETRRRSKFETVKIPKNLSYLIPLPLHVRRAFSLFLPPILYALHSSVCPTDSPYDVSGLPYQENYDEDAKPPQQVSLSYDESLESGYSTPNSRGRRIIREIIV